MHATDRWLLSYHASMILKAYSQAYLHNLQVDFIVAFLGVTYARAVAAPLNPNYKLVSLL